MGQKVSSLNNVKLNPISAKAGVGLRQQHLLNFVEGGADVSWVEVHAENFMGVGGPRLNGLLAVRDHYPVSLHGVGTSLGSAEGLDLEHLIKFSKLIDQVEPALISEHLSWSVTGGQYLNDLLPLPLNKESFQIVSNNIDKMQNHFKRQILIENPSVYLSLNNSDIPEFEFLNNLAKTTGCELLLDVNNIYVSCVNTGSNPAEYIKHIDFDKVKEIHIAGHSEEYFEGQKVLIDTHGSPVCDDVWKLLDKALEFGGTKPVLMEWDTNLPSFEILMDDVYKADEIINRYSDIAYVA